MSMNDEQQFNQAAPNAVRYLDASALNRPQKITNRQKPFALVLVVLGVLVGAFMLFQVVDNFVLASTHVQERMEQNLNRDVSLDLPKIKKLVGLSDDKLRSTLEKDATIFDYPTSSDDETAFDVVKLPSDKSEGDIKPLYEKGIASLKADEAVLALFGAWRLDTSSTNGYFIRLRYADFTSGSVEAAITAAMDSQGLKEKSVLESDVDNSGNTYKTGQKKIDGTTYTWRISALPLSDMYDISGLPENAVFVGIRYTKQ